MLCSAILHGMLLTCVPCVVFGIKIREEYADEKHRFVSMEEIEKKSAFYLRHRKGIGNEEEIKEKVTIMCDRIQELYREHGLDSIHNLFENEEDLEYMIDSEDQWQKYVMGLTYPRKPGEWKYARHFLVTVATIFIMAIVLSTPYSYKYAKRFVKGHAYNIDDEEWKGADSSVDVLVRRVKKRSRRILYKPMLPSFELKTESVMTSEAELRAATEYLKIRLKKEQAFKEKKKKQWEEQIRKCRLDMDRRERILLDDDVDSEAGKGRVDDQERKSTTGEGADEQTTSYWKTIVNVKKLKRFPNGKFYCRKVKKEL